MWPWRKREITINVAIDGVVIECLKSIASDAERTADAIEELDELRTGISELICLHNDINRRLAKMASETKAALDSLLSAVNSNVASISARIAALESQSQRTDMSPEEEADIKTQLESLNGALAALAAVPA